jgi:hypothetical protein
MRISFEKNARPPYPKEIEATIQECKRLHPDLLTVEQYLKNQGFDTKTLE